MISKKVCYLYQKRAEEGTRIRINLYANMNITTTWDWRNTIKTHARYKIILYNLKINGCAICGYNKCDACLEFHHINPENKKFNLSIRDIGRKNNLLAEELNKCILLCNRCHREIHIRELLNDTK